MKQNIKYIFVVGGVMSGVGKGIASASMGKIIQSRGFKVTAIKIDPYVNVDAGTMNPTEHGETFVLDDGKECDQDMGNYERFLGYDLTSANYMTTGSIYQSVINKERNLEYNGSCVEVVPHIPLEILDRLNKAAIKNKAEIVMVEIGGTVGEYQNILFLEAIRMLRLKNPKDVLLALVSYLPYQGEGGELKTKPTQYAVRTLNSAGLQPDIILARAKFPLDKKRKNKIAFNCNVSEESVISAPDVENIYEVPINFERDNLSEIILKKLFLKPKKRNLTDWRKFIESIKNARGSIKIGVVGKYFGTGEFILSDSYISVIEAIKHAVYSFNKKPVIHWLNSEEFDPLINSGQNAKNLKKLKDYHGIIVPGGFGSRGVEGKIAVIKYCREHKIPFLGLCYGMQLAVVEYSRSKAGLKNANTTEVNPKTTYPVIDILPEQKKNMLEKNYGGSMRLGSYPAALKEGTIAISAYKQPLISERHRHRYEVNPRYVSILEKKGLIFSGFSPDNRLMEIIELPISKHPFFVASQFHPEFKSNPLNPHPLFKEFIRAAIKNR
ncbi:MAG: CTP synthase [Patescibacteria group bacterium]|mgnify:CR=1 FL=1